MPNVGFFLVDHFVVCEESANKFKCNHKGNDGTRTGLAEMIDDKVYLVPGVLVRFVEKDDKKDKKDKNDNPDNEDNIYISTGIMVDPPTSTILHQISTGMEFPNSPGADTKYEDLENLDGRVVEVTNDGETKLTYFVKAGSCKKVDTNALKLRTLACKTFDALERIINADTG